jgi:hypothetical protein
VGFKPFKCEKCDKTFSSSSNLNQHLSIHNLKKKRSNYICFAGDCKKTYFYICTLKKHIQVCHRNEYESIVGVFSERNFSHYYNKMRKRRLLEEKFEFVKFKKDDAEKVESEKTQGRNDQKVYFAVKKHGPDVMNFKTSENISDDRTIAHNDDYSKNFIITNKINEDIENCFNLNEFNQKINNIHNLNNDISTISSSNNSFDYNHYNLKMFFELSNEILAKISALENLKIIINYEMENLVGMVRVKCPNLTSLDI